MNKKWSLLLTLTLLAAIVGLGTSTTAAQGPGDGPVATVSVEPTRIEWQPLVSYAGLVLTVSGPDGLFLRQEFGAGSVPSFESSGRPDGSYTYELRVIPVIAPETRQALDAARESGDSSAVEQLQQQGKLPQQPLVQSGYFSIDGGAIVMGGATEEPAVQSLDEPPISALDQVITDDLIVDHLCAGEDCVDGEYFDWRPIIIKENNTRIYFEDTSTLSGFADNDWRIAANDSGEGGANRFFIGDLGAGPVAGSGGGKIPFTIMAGAPDNALYVDSTDNWGQTVPVVGIGTSTPAAALHIVDADTPAVRLEQDGSAGWTPQTWNVAGNDFNFFIQDVTNGWQLPFRIQPGAPDNSIYITSSGDVGIGTPFPAEKLHVTGSVLVEGNVTEYSDVNTKENFAPVNGQEVLERLAEVPVTTWSFKADDPSVRHMGPMAQDFYAAFGLGRDERHIAPLDTNGVALAGVQELYQMVQENDAQIAQLQQQNAELEERVEALERLVNSLAQEDRK
jgi:hypothetical protein